MDDRGVKTDIAAAYHEWTADKPRYTEDGLELAPTEPWKEHMPVASTMASRISVVPADAVRVAMLRAAGVEDTVALGEALGMPPAKVTALEAVDGFANALKRLRLAAGLGNWRSHVEAVVATGNLPSGTVAPAPTQAQLLLELWGREEPKATLESDAQKTTIIITGDGMARVMAGLAEAGRPTIDVTPRRVAPSTDGELERQREIYHADD